MVAPWLRYETYGVTVMGNVIHDTQGAGLGINGGYNTVMAYNTLSTGWERAVTPSSRARQPQLRRGNGSVCGQPAGGRLGGVGMDGQYIPRGTRTS